MNEPTPGQVDVLNSQLGHLEIKFDKNDPAKTEEARKAVTDMLKRGYHLVAHVNGEDVKVTEFDPKNDTYKLVGLPPVEASQTKVTAIAPSAGG